MRDLNTHDEQPPVCLLAGALAHLAQHMENACPRSAYLAIMLLEQIAENTKADAYLRQHAQQLVEILECEPLGASSREISPKLPSPTEASPSIVRNGVP